MGGPPAAGVMEFRGEFVDNGVFAMAGASNRHAILHRNFTWGAFGRLEGPSAGRWAPIPDGDDDIIEKPVVVVLLPSPKKFDSRRQIATLSNHRLPHGLRAGKPESNARRVAHAPVVRYLASPRIRRSGGGIDNRFIDLSIPPRRIHDGVTIRPAI